MKIAIMILAAGSSSRMGEIKQLLPIRNKTLLGSSIDNALACQANQVFCVLGANFKIISKSINHYDIEIIQNSNFKEGLSSSIIAGISHIKSYQFDAVLIMLGDQPLVNSKHLNNLINELKDNPTQIIASRYKNKNGVPAIFPNTFFKHLTQLKGDKGAGLLLNSETINVNTISGPSLIDIDTKTDYINFINTL